MSEKNYTLKAGEIEWNPQKGVTVLITAIKPPNIIEAHQVDSRYNSFTRRMETQEMKPHELN